MPFPCDCCLATLLDVFRSAWRGFERMNAEKDRNDPDGALSAMQIAKQNGVESEFLKDDQGWS